MRMSLYNEYVLLEKSHSPLKSKICLVLDCEQSLICLKIRGQERKTSERA